MTAEITRGCTSGYFLDAFSAQKPYSRIYYSKNISRHSKPFSTFSFWIFVSLHSDYLSPVSIFKPTVAKH
jgi:hypothetical protein